MNMVVITIGQEWGPSGCSEVSEDGGQSGMVAGDCDPIWRYLSEVILIMMITVMIDNNEE